MGPNDFDSNDSQSALSGASPAPQSQPSSPVVQAAPLSPVSSNGKVSLFRQLLAGALQGMAGGFAEPSNPAEGMQRIQEIQTAPQRLAMQRQQVAIQQQEADTQRSEAQSQNNLREAQAALATVDKLHLENLIQQMPAQLKNQTLDTWANVTRAYGEAGLRAVATLDDTPEARTAFLQQIKANSGKVTDFIFGPSTEQGKLIAFRSDNTKVLPKDIAAQLSHAVGIQLPEGLPIPLADTIISGKLRKDAELAVENLRVKAMQTQAPYMNSVMQDVTGWTPAPGFFMTQKQLVDARNRFINNASYKAAQNAETSYQMANLAYTQYKQAGGKLPTGAQSMLMLSQHLATTFGNVKGSRVTKDMIQEHLGARSVSDAAQVAVQKLTNGDQLSPAQWDAFHGLIAEARVQAWQAAIRSAHAQGLPVTPDLEIPKDAVGGLSQPIYAVNPQTKQRIMSLDGGKTWQAAQ